MANFNFDNLPSIGKQPDLTPKPYDGTPQYDATRQAYPDQFMTGKLGREFTTPGGEQVDIAANQTVVDRLDLEPPIQVNLEDIPLTLAELRAEQDKQRAQLRAEVRAELEAELLEKMKPAALIEAARQGAKSKLKSFLGGLREGYARRRDNANESLKNTISQGVTVAKNLWSGLLGRGATVAKTTAQVAVGTAAVGVGAGVVAAKVGSRAARGSYDAVASRVREVSWNLANKKYQTIGGLERATARYVRLQNQLEETNSAILEAKSGIQRAREAILGLQVDDIDDALQQGDFDHLDLDVASRLQEVHALIQDKTALERTIDDLNLQSYVDEAGDLHQKIAQNNPGYIESQEGQDSKLVRSMRQAQHLLGLVNKNQVKTAVQEVAVAAPIVTDAEMEPFGFQGQDGQRVDPAAYAGAPTPTEVVTSDPVVTPEVDSEFDEVEPTTQTVDTVATRTEDPDENSPATTLETLRQNHQPTQTDPEAQATAEVEDTPTHPAGTESNDLPPVLTEEELLQDPEYARINAETERERAEAAAQKLELEQLLGTSLDEPVSAVVDTPPAAEAIDAVESAPDPVSVELQESHLLRAGQVYRLPELSPTTTITLSRPGVLPLQLFPLSGGRVNLDKLARDNAAHGRFQIQGDLARPQDGPIVLTTGQGNNAADPQLKITIVDGVVESVRPVSEINLDDWRLEVA